MCIRKYGRKSYPFSGSALLRIHFHIYFCVVIPWCLLVNISIYRHSKHKFQKFIHSIVICYMFPLVFGHYQAHFTTKYSAFPVCGCKNNRMKGQKTAETCSGGQINLYCSQSAGDKSRRKRWTGQEAHMGEGRGVYRILVGKPGGRRPLGRPRYRWEDNIKLYLKKVGCRGMGYIQLAQNRDRLRALLNAVTNLRVP